MQKLMKKIVYAIAALALIFTSCAKELENTTRDNFSKVRLHVKVADQLTKVSADNDGRYHWQAGDEITVFNDSDEPFTFSTEQGGSDVDFGATSWSGDLGKYAMYPSGGHVVDVDEIVFELPTSIDWAENTTNMPMLGKITSEVATFKAVGGVLKLVCNNIPSGAAALLFSATNKQIVGDFTIADGKVDSPVISTKAKAGSNNELLIDFTGHYSSDMVFYIPLPTGTIDGFTVSLLDGASEELYSITSTASPLVGRNELILAPELNVPDLDVLNRVFTGVSVGKTYNDWSSKSGQSSTAVYAGNSAGGEDADDVNGALQLRSNTNSGIITTTTGGLIRKLVVDWHTQTAADRTLDVYGKQTAYSSTSDLYSPSTQGELIGSIVNGTSTELVIAKNKYYPYIGIRSRSGAHYINSISIAWDTDSRSTLSAPTFSEVEGEIPAGTTVYLASAESANIKYTLDGTTPTESSTAYTDSGIVVDDDVTIKAIAIKDGWKNSTVSSISFTVPVCATPTFDTAAGTISSGDDVVIENNESGAVIYYTTDGSEPNGSSSYGAAGANVTIADIDATITIKAFARKSGMKDSPIASATYTVSGSTVPLSAPSTITFEPYADTFTATWENNANATGYEWVISTSETSAGINLSEDAHGDFTVASPGAGNTLSAGTWTVSQSVSLTIATKYYLYVKVKGDGSTYSDSGYSTPVNKIVPLVITYANVSDTSYPSSEKTFTNNSKSFGYVQVMRNGKGTPTNWAAAQTLQFKGNSTTPGVLYNKTALGTSIKNIRVYLVVNNNAFTLAYGTDTSVSTGSKTRTQYTTTDTYSMKVNHKDGGTLDATVNVYDYDLSSFNVNYFKLTNGSSANYVWRIEVTYQ